MPDFAQIAALQVSGEDTTEVVLFELEGRPVLVCRPATEDNSDFTRAVLKQTRAQILLNSGPAEEVDLDADRRRDRQLYPKHVVVGWRDVVDRSGAPVEFSEENCAAFLKALPRDIFDRVRNRVSRCQTFRPEKPTDAEAKDLAGN